MCKVIAENSAVNRPSSDHRALNMLREYATRMGGVLWFVSFVFSQVCRVEQKICQKLEHSIAVVNSYECILIQRFCFFNGVCSRDTCHTHFELDSCM